MQALWKTDTLTIGSAEGDRVALGILYKSADAELRVLLTGWNTFADLEEWAGGTINQEGRVIKIVLQRTFRGLVEPSRWKELGSSILAEVCQLGALEELKLEYLGLMAWNPTVNDEHESITAETESSTTSGCGCSCPAPVFASDCPTNVFVLPGLKSSEVTLKPAEAARFPWRNPTASDWPNI